MKTIVCVVGARPNFIKIAPIMRAISARRGISARLVHTGQHYGSDMSDSFFEELGIPKPDINLEVGSSSHAFQTAEIMQKFEPALDSGPADAVLVVGDVNSTIACALVAAKKGIPVIHVEAGLRSFDRKMPEEINRVLTDRISDLLYTTSEDAEENLIREGVDREHIVFVGNVMIDTLMYNLDRAVPAVETLGGDQPLADNFALLTLHRPSNVDDPAVFKLMLEAIAEISRSLPIVFPVHPRTAKSIRDFGFGPILERSAIRVLEPVSYLRMLGLLRQCKLVLTDSGGLQEESTALGTPCLTLRNNTERPVTVTDGSNTLVGASPETLLTEFGKFQAGLGKSARIPPLWDGKAAERIVDHLDGWLSKNARP